MRSVLQHVDVGNIIGIGCGISAKWIVVCMGLVCENEWSYGVMVSTLDFESSDPGSNPGRTSL